VQEGQEQFVAALQTVPFSTHRHSFVAQGKSAKIKGKVLRAAGAKPLKFQAVIHKKKHFDYVIATPE
jgi:ligand-binding SRPBCC domain-containing protein